MREKKQSLFCTILIMISPKLLTKNVTEINKRWSHILEESKGIFSFFLSLVSSQYLQKSYS